MVQVSTAVFAPGTAAAIVEQFPVSADKPAFSKYSSAFAADPSTAAISNPVLPAEMSE
jgi:hypothetical protein